MRASVRASCASLCRASFAHSRCACQARPRGREQLGSTQFPGRAPPLRERWPGFRCEPYTYVCADADGAIFFLLLRSFCLFRVGSISNPCLLSKSLKKNFFFFFACLMVRLPPMSLSLSPRNSVQAPSPKPEAAAHFPGAVTDSLRFTSTFPQNAWPARC